MTGVARFFQGAAALKRITTYPVPESANAAAAGIPLRSLVVTTHAMHYQDRQARGSSAVFDRLTEGRYYTLELETDLNYQNLAELILACGLGAVNNAGQKVAGKQNTYEYSYYMLDDPSEFFNLAVHLQVTDDYNETGIYEYTGCVPTGISISGRSGTEPIRLRATLLAFDELHRVSTTLASDISAADTVVPADGKGEFFDSRGYIVLDDGVNTEFVLYRAIDTEGNKFLDCLRGQLGSSAHAFSATSPQTSVASLSATESMDAVTIPSTPSVEWDDLVFRANPNGSGELTDADAKSVAGFTLTITLALRQRIGQAGFLEQPIKVDFNEVSLAIDRHQIDDNRPRFDLRNDTAHKAELAFISPHLVDTSDALPYRLIFQLPNLKFSDAPRGLGRGGDISPTDRYVALDGNQPPGMGTLVDGTTAFTRELCLTLRNGRSESVLA